LLLPDINVLAHAFREDSPEHIVARRWLGGLVEGNEAFATSDLLFSGFLRIVTHPAIFDPPNTLAAGLEFVESLGSHPNRVAVRPGERHWRIFIDLCERTGARGNAIPDAYLAALAIESGSDLVTFDHRFGRFRGLRWQQLGI
jgi:uncharacterized protein